MMRGSIVTLFLPLVVMAQTNPTDLAKTHTGWAAASSPGASLELREQSRAGNVITFRICAKGLPADTPLNLINWPVTSLSPINQLPGVTLDASGMAICAGKPGTCGRPDMPDDPIDLKMAPLPGEPVRLALATPDGKTARAMAKFVPVPLRGDDNGCAVSVELLTARGEAVMVVATGFPPETEVQFRSDSAGEAVSQKVKTDKTGKYSTLLLPFVKGKTLASPACR